jgi:hypothetical protein
MAMETSAPSRLYLKRNIDRLTRVRALMGLDIVQMRSQPGYLSRGDFAEATNTLFGVEDELRELVRQYEGTAQKDCRD